MYYILNETNQLIAADEEMLSLCGATHIEALSSKIAKDDISLQFIDEETLIIRIEEDAKTFQFTKTSLSGLLGDLHLIHISTSNAHNDDILTINTPQAEPQEDTLELFELLDDNQNTADARTQETSRYELNEEMPIDLGISDEKNIFPQNQNLEVEAITIDINKTSQKIGISQDDYQNFLNEFIDTALVLEDDLQSENHEKRSEAIHTLSQLVEVLHIPIMGDIIINIDNTDKANQLQAIESFYHTLSRITTKDTKEDNEDIITIIEETRTPEETLELFTESENIEQATIEEEVTHIELSSNQSFGSISLEGIKPKHFDFQLEEAANDLSLPVELIEEFVHDFIDQSHIETKKMLEAYEKGDLDTIQKIGHLLKGASSNLRINALADTLYKIQFCEKPDQLEMLIKDYWAHFLSFENQLNMSSN